MFNDVNSKSMKALGENSNKLYVENNYGWRFDKKELW